MKYVIVFISLFLITSCSDESPAPASSAGAVTTAAPAPSPAKRPDNEEFAMDVADFFVIAGDRIVVTGQIESGSVATGETICISSKTRDKQQAEVTGIEQFNKIIQQAAVGEHVGIMLGGIDKQQVGKGDRLSSCQ